MRGVRRSGKPRPATSPAAEEILVVEWNPPLGTEPLAAVLERAPGTEDRRPRVPTPRVPRGTRPRGLVLPGAPGPPRRRVGGVGRAWVGDARSPCRSASSACRLPRT